MNTGQQPTQKIITLEGMGAWVVVEHEEEGNAINGTWAFKFKQFPNGTVKGSKPAFVSVEISS